jgi:hypothetical protein
MTESFSRAAWDVSQTANCKKRKEFSQGWWPQAAPAISWNATPFSSGSHQHNTKSELGNIEELIVASTQWICLPVLAVCSFRHQPNLSAATVNVDGLFASLSLLCR